MPVSAHITPSASAVAALFVDQFDRDVARVSMPRPEAHLVVRMGASARNGLDVYAFGVRQKAHRKLIRGGHRTVQARLRLGAHSAVLGVPASELAGRVIPLEELWGQVAVERLYNQLADTRDLDQAAAVLDNAIAERVAHFKHNQHTQLVLDSAEMLISANVNTVAVNLGVSERHLRRVFHETLGVSPKTFARLTRFHRALRAAREDARASWASIAANSGYYDQAHLIAEFRVMTGVTPQALLAELSVQPTLA